MNFLGGSLPNIMFIIGMLSMGLGLGIELKLVPLSKEIDRTGRIGAMVVGAILVAGSLYIYLGSTVQVVQTWYTSRHGFSNSYLTRYRRQRCVDRTAFPSRRVWLSALSRPSE